MVVSNRTTWPVPCAATEQCNSVSVAKIPDAAANRLTTPRRTFAEAIACMECVRALLMTLTQGFAVDLSLTRGPKVLCLNVVRTVPTIRQFLIVCLERKLYPSTTSQDTDDRDNL